MLTLCVLFSIVAAQAEADVSAYLGLEGGRSWRYADGSESSRLDVSEVQVNGAAVLELAGSDGTRRVQSFDPESGLLLHSMAFSDGTTVEYERPVVLLPPGFEPGAVHSSQRRFVRLRGGEKLGVGAHYFEAELVGTTSVETPAGRFENCLEIRRHAVRMDYAAGQKGFDVTEWYAPGVGLVKAKGERFVRDENGEPLTTEPFALELASVDP